MLPDLESDKHKLPKIKLNWGIYFPDSLDNTTTLMYNIHYLITIRRKLYNATQQSNTRYTQKLF